MGFQKAFLLVSILLQFGHSANILGIFPIPSKSHDILGKALFEHLAKIGHNVTYISPFYHKNFKNFNHIHVKECQKFKDGSMKKYTQGNATTLQIIRQFFTVTDLTTTFFENESVQRLIMSDSKFDLLIHFMGVDGTLAFADHFNVPVIVFAPVGGFAQHDNIIGNPAPLSYVPKLLMPFTDEMNLFERTANTIASAVFALVPIISNFFTNQCIEKYLPGSPTMDELSKKIDLILVNSHISTETPRPYVPNMIQIGGYHLQEPEPLPNELKRVLDEAKDGFIYFSFGTNVNVKELSEDILQVFKKVLGALPFKVIMKYEEDSMPDKPLNFELGKWFPQPSVLAHPNAKLFISHGGYGGCTESLFYGVPLVCIPFFGDQQKNCVDAETGGYSVTVNLNDLNEKTFSDALQKVLYDEKFRDAVKLKSELYRDQPMNPMDKAVYWIEHVIKYKGAKHLKVKGAELPWYQYHLIDVFLFIGVILFVIFSIIFYTCSFVCRKICELRKNKVKIN